ncbi:type II toxin-antitoxin system VapC family toxin [Gloeocapsopsis dulcis]|uniref:Twitching motility protein PilT n=1 Tax=Gloeocapsopsis dulcis AAB1 = 1H9 TaxID=1433147 RepID=A0A6N8FZF2_9CHRO|nr:PIN domain-containing protein [Gloeocapsopsis dulcis]MUL38331.1 twitching motility protein PilT [Gloeocapsopsis dulcis AAB1 = 1H9]WNN91171.1 PIN domain-containing protein [Gloeocapsopsis dulcis]
MKVIVDTSVWSLALRRSRSSQKFPQVTTLRELILVSKAALLGVIRQEVLSGIRETEQFTCLRDYLRAFPNLELEIEDYEKAAEFYNTCRKNGIQGSNTDFLICAVAYRRGYSILTTDGDFTLFDRYLPVTLWQ